MDDTKVGAEAAKQNSPADVAKEGFDALMAGKDSVVGSTTLMTKVQGALNEVLPEACQGRVSIAASPSRGRRGRSRAAHRMDILLVVGQAARLPTR